MSAQPLKGFPLPDDYATTRVPNAVLGRVLSHTDDADTIKLILRSIWLLERKRGYPPFLTIEDLRRDRVLSLVIGDSSAFERTVASAIKLGVLAEVSLSGKKCLMLNTESAQRATSEAAVPSEVDEDDDDGWDAPAASQMPTDAFRAYEENIGVLSPMIRESILSALEDFTDEDITHAVRIAVENESRSWSFVAGVLRRWTREGVPHERRDGKSGRQSERERVSEVELRKYLDEQRKRSRAGSS